MKLTNKVAIVTGSGQGIGRAYAQRFAREGAKVVIADINAENAQRVANEIEANGGQALPLHTDVSSETSTAQMAKQAAAHFGRLDIPLNNAAIYYGLGRIPWDQWTVEQWNKQWAVNVVGIWQCVKAVAPYMIKQDKGKIINITFSVVYSGQQLMLPYVCSKGAVDAMTRSLAKELGVHNICVNSIAPGFTMSEASRTAYPANEIEKRTEHIRNLRCIKRDEVEDDLAGTAVYLASDDSDFVTGQAIAVDGGIVMR